MATRNQLEVKTLASMESDDANAKRIFWSEDLQIQSATKDVFSALEGPEGSGKPICLKQDLAAGRGHTVNFHTINPIGGPGVLGGNRLEGNEENMTLGGYSVRVEILRHAIGLQYAAEEFTNIGSKLDNTARKLLADWYGRRKQRNMALRLREDAFTSGLNVLRPNGRANREALTLTDTLDTSTIEEADELARTNGAMPSSMGYHPETGSEIQHFMVVSSHTALKSLKADSSYLDGLQEAGVRGPNNRLFQGGFENWAGHGIMEWNVVDSAGKIPAGCPILPKAYLGTAISAGTAVLDITGGGASTDTTTEFFESFSNAAWQEYADVAASPSTTDRYVVIWNKTGADAGKWGFYRYVTNDMNKLTTKDETGNASTGAGGRLGAGIGGTESSKIGNVTWDADLHTESHPVGSLVFEANSYGVPIGGTFFLGRMAAVRAYGSIRSQRIFQGEDYGDSKGIGVKSIFGQNTCKRSDNLPPNYVYVEHAVSYPGVDTSLT